MYEYHKPPTRRFQTPQGEVELNLYDRDRGSVFFGGTRSHFVVNGVALRGNVDVVLTDDGWVTAGRDIRRMYGTKTSPHDLSASESQKDKTEAAIVEAIKIWGAKPDVTLLAQAHRTHRNNRLATIEDEIKRWEEYLARPHRDIHQLADEASELEHELEVTSPLQLGPCAAALYSVALPEIK